MADRRIIDADSERYLPGSPSKDLLDELSRVGGYVEAYRDTSGLWWPTYEQPALRHGVWQVRNVYVEEVPGG